MVHALQVVHRVLRPAGLLIDLRPGPFHRRVGLMEGDRFVEIGCFEESLVEDRAANGAIKSVIGQGLFRRVHHDRFLVNRHLDSFESFEVWYEDFSHEKPCKYNRRLVERVRKNLASFPAGTPIVVTGPLILNLLQKCLS